MQAIKAAVQFAADHGVDFPFARKHTTYLFNKKILIDIPGTGLMDASGRQRSQLNMKKILEVYLKEVGFGANGLADSYTAFHNESVKVLLNPGYTFGLPVVYPCGQTAWSLWEACRSEGGVEEAANAYRVSVKEVLVACKYIESIRPATAA